jgi:hypothetical protein
MRGYVSGFGSTRLQLTAIQLSVSASGAEQHYHSPTAQTVLISASLLISPPAGCTGAQCTSRWARPHRLQLRHPFAVHHHADNQHLYRHLRQTPVSRLSKSVILLLLSKLALDGRTLAPADDRRGSTPRKSSRRSLLDYSAVPACRPPCQRKWRCCTPILPPPPAMSRMFCNSLSSPESPKSPSQHKLTSAPASDIIHDRPLQQAFKEKAPCMSRASW